MEKAGDTSQKVGDRMHDAECRSQESGVRIQETEDKMICNPT
jgi:hypothetical protein